MGDVDQRIPTLGLADVVRGVQPIRPAAEIFCDFEYLNGSPQVINPAVGTCSFLLIKVICLFSTAFNNCQRILLRSKNFSVANKGRR